MNETNLILLYPLVWHVGLIFDEIGDQHQNPLNTRTITFDRAVLKLVTL